ncbi:Crp/Fnr family transcriptional regulator [Indioceanicola profundi]|uniref:Crp/Fnr family transcriptional regulator n=1 Tax=Indioceanicola profundi TaxID=2220096 RepID=UPI0013C4108B|nr:Crp/Fnr family transcriptional regulator [Indioceanicola profundi]
MAPKSCSLLGSDRKETALHLKLESYVPLSEPERAYISQLVDRAEVVRPRIDIIHQGEQFASAHVLLSGWAIRHKALPDGRRQVVNFVIPGDFIGLYAHLFEIADHTVTTLTGATTAAVEIDRIVEIFKRFPRLAAALAWSSAREESIIAERLLSLGRRTAFERMAHLLAELLRRLQVVQLAYKGQFILPVTQETLADALGLSLVHVNRTLRRLREAGLIDIDGQKLMVNDAASLADAGKFDEMYLHHSGLSRRLQKKLAPA